MREFLREPVLRLLETLDVWILAYFIGLNFVYLALIAISFLHIRKQLRQKQVYSLKGLFSSNLYNPISILAPAYNEESTVVASVKSLLQLQFPNYEIIVINDGSKDRTMDVLIEHFRLKPVDRYVPLVLHHQPIKTVYKSELYPELVVVDKVNGRKADALNAGINVSRNDLFCAIDADSVLEPLVLQNMLRCFIEDETTIAVGGIVRVANDCVFENNELKEVRIPKSYYARIQVVEYLRAFLFGRVGWDYLDSLLIISGAFGIFDRKAVLAVGGYLHDTVGEDMELVVRLHRYHRERKIPYRVRFIPEPVCWTEVPEDPAVLSRQRNRWQRGLADTLWRHRKMFMNPTYGRLGFVAVPFFVFFELLGPIVEFGGFALFILAWWVDALNMEFTILFLASAVLLGMVLSVASVLCEEFTYRRYPRLKHVVVMIAYAFLENIGYRQRHAWWRLQGLWDFLKGNKEWGAMTRKGLGAAAGNAATAPKPKPAAPARKMPWGWLVMGVLALYLVVTRYDLLRYVHDPDVDAGRTLVQAPPPPPYVYSPPFPDGYRHWVVGTFRSRVGALAFAEYLATRFDHVNVVPDPNHTGGIWWQVGVGRFPRDLSYREMLRELGLERETFPGSFPWRVPATQAAAFDTTATRTDCYRIRVAADREVGCFSDYDTALAMRTWLPADWVEQEPVVVAPAGSGSEP